MATLAAREKSRSEYNSVVLTLVWPKHRVIVLSDDAKDIVKRNLDKNKSGLPFQNKDSKNSTNEWTTAAVRSRFRRAEQDLGFRIQQKALRHYWGTQFLKSGGQAAQGAAFMGHSDTRMILGHYQCVGQDQEHLIAEANRVKAIRFEQSPK
jgi:integrase